MYMYSISQKYTHTHLAMLKMYPKHVKVLKLIFILLHVTKRIHVHVQQYRGEKEERKERERREGG